MTAQEALQIALVTLGVVAGASVLIGNIYYVIRSKTARLQKEELEVLREEVSLCESKHQESQKDIHRLQGQIDVLKDIPLKDINAEISSISRSNQKILSTLEKSALIAENTDNTTVNQTVVK